MDPTKEIEFANINQKRLLSGLSPKLIKLEAGLYSRLQKAKLNPLKKLKSLYGAMDIIFSHVDAFTPCKKGCSACCHYNVSISEIEIAYIESNEKIKRSQHIGPKRDFHGEPCVFLSNSGSCGIYESRPFMCRRHTALTKTSYFCESIRSNTESFPMIAFSEVDKAFNLILSESGFSNMAYDIRQVFASK